MNISAVIDYGQTLEVEVNDLTNTLTIYCRDTQASIELHSDELADINRLTTLVNWEK